LLVKPSYALNKSTIDLVERTKETGANSSCYLHGTSAILRVLTIKDDLAPRRAPQSKASQESIVDLSSQRPVSNQRNPPPSASSPTTCYTTKRKISLPSSLGSEKTCYLGQPKTPKTNYHVELGSLLKTTTEQTKKTTPFRALAVQKTCHPRPTKQIKNIASSSGSYALRTLSEEKK
jgi:hypothetical protein